MRLKAFIKKAIDLEDKTSYEPGPPVVLKPAHESLWRDFAGNEQ
jgi:hypothetical protein